MSIASRKVEETVWAGWEERKVLLVSIADLWELVRGYQMQRTEEEARDCPAEMGVSCAIAIHRSVPTPGTTSSMQEKKKDRKQQDG